MDNYICECGKTFMTPNSFNGHKSHCVVHLEKTGRLHIRQQVDATNGAKQSKSLKQRATKIKQEQLQQWLLEEHTCEKCGKVMTTMYGSGRFCSRSCSNSHLVTEQTKDKIRTTYAVTLKDHPELRNTFSTTARINGWKTHQRALDKYYKNPIKCCICGTIIPFEKRCRKTCSDECESVLISRKSKEAVIRHGGNLNQKGFKSHFQGNYKGYHCDSTWELAFIVYHLENELPFKRNTEHFPYIYEGQEHNYFPDFIIDDIYYEVKGYHNDIVQAKINQFPKDKKLVVLYYDDMKPMIDYCISKYGSNYWESLYE